MLNKKHNEAIRQIAMPVVTSIVDHQAVAVTVTIHKEVAEVVTDHRSVAVLVVIINDEAVVVNLTTIHQHHLPEEMTLATNFEPTNNSSDR